MTDTADQEIAGLRENCRHALEAIAPCVVGWKPEQVPEWVKPLRAVVPELRKAIGLDSEVSWGEDE